jgi:hypothetical protein
MGLSFIIEMFNLVRAKDYELDLDYTKITDIDLTSKDSLGMIPDENGELQSISIDGLVHSETQYGIHVVSATKTEEKLKYFRDLAFSQGQNGNNSMAAIAINSDNPLIIQTKLQELDELLVLRQKASEAEALASNERIQESKMASEQADRDLKKYLGELKEKGDTIRAQMLSNKDDSVTNDAEKMALEQGKLHLKELELSLKQTSESNKNALGLGKLANDRKKINQQNKPTK